MNDKTPKPVPRRGSPRSGEDDRARQLPKRFYKNAAAVASDAGHAIELDGRPVKTPKRDTLYLPTAALATAVADEWNALGDTIDPARLPLTKIANTAIDGVMGREREVHDDIVRFIGNDLLFYRAEAPEGLVARQSLAWDPVLDWFVDTYDAEFRTTTGVMPIEQNLLTVAKAASALTDENALTLTPLHVMTTLTGSALLAIAHKRGHIGIDEVWNAAHVDEDWQIEHWGEDAEATERRAIRRNELEAAACFLALARL